MNNAVSYSHTASRPEQDKNGKIRTSTNRLVDPWNLHVENISIVDIAEQLSCETRYAGAVGFYSVAQHSRLVADLVRSKYALDKLSATKLALVALLHDAEEAYLKDMPSPIKRRPEMTEYVEAGHRARSVIFQRFHLSGSRAEHDELMEIIDPFDKEMYFLERKSFDGFASPELTIQRESPELASMLFFQAFNPTYDAYLKELLNE